MTKRDDDGDTMTTYRDGDGKLVTVETHALCGGHGCDGCSGLGFMRVATPHTEKSSRAAREAAR